MALSASLVKHRRGLAKLWLRWRLVIVAAAALLVVIAGANFAWRELAARSDRFRQEAIESASSAIAQSVSKLINAQSRSIRSLVEGADLASLVTGGDVQAIAAAEAEMAARMPGLLRARIVRAGTSKTDYETSPPLSFAAIDLLRRSERSAGAISPEVHLFGESAEHIALASRIEGADGVILGHVLFALDLDVLRDTMRGMQLRSGYAELQQPVGKGPALVVARHGNRADRQGAPALRIPVPSTLWRVAYWAEAAAPVGAAMPIPLWAVGALLVALVVAAAAQLMRRRGPVATPEPQPVVEGEALSGKLGALHEAGDGVPMSAALDEVAAGEPAADEALAGFSVSEIAPSIFRAYDVRGVVGETLTAEVVNEIGKAIGSEAHARGQQTLVVACDGRSSSPELLEALIEGLCATGRDVVDVGRVPTPVLYFATHYLNTGSGVMVTGSHNPPEYNGLKIMLGGDTLFGDDIQALGERVQTDDTVSGAGSRQSMEIVDEYIRRVTEDVPVALGDAYKVVVDCGNGIAGVVAPKLLRALGHDVVELYCEVDGSFPNHHPDPGQPENLADLIQAVREHDADIGFAFDGDGDRLGVVDPQGNAIWPDRQLMLFAHDVLKRDEHKGAEIVFDVKCSNLLAKVIAKSGGKPVMCKTGHSFIKNELKQRGAPLAGELSGHIFFNDRWYGFDDALYAAARMLEILLATRRKPVDVFARLPAGVSTHEMRMDMSEGEPAEFMSELLAEPRFEDGKVTTIDGLRVDFADGWGLVRASNTTPSLVLRFEGKTAEALARVQERFREVLLAVRPDLALPF
jgi:phosphomannomutase/phosphoglucomutase